MNFKTKKYSLFILLITSLLLSRTIFAFFDDPEGPNLLVVIIMAAVIYMVSFVISKLTFKNITEEVKKVFSTMVVQIIFSFVIYFLLG